MSNSMCNYCAVSVNLILFLKGGKFVNEINTEKKIREIFIRRKLGDKMNEFIGFDESDGLEAVLLLGNGEKYTFITPWADDDDVDILWDYEVEKQYRNRPENEKTTPLIITADKMQKISEILQSD